MSGALGWRASWTLARRDLVGRLRGLRLLFICLLLGVTTLAAIGSLTAAITGELAAQGQTILGGDYEVALSQRVATAEEQAALARTGQVSATLRTRAMARAGDSAILTELKAVDRAYPLYGAVEGVSLAGLGPDEVVIDRALAERLQRGRGDRLRYGEAEFRIRGVMTAEPDRVGEGFTLGPVALVSLDGLARTGLLQPGALYTAKYRVRTAGDPAPAIAALKDRWAEAGWTFKSRDAAAPGANRFFERMGQFLSLIGLAALVIAGIGVSNGVASYLAMKRNGIATLKVLGATSADIARIYLLQIGMVALAAVLLGLAIGALAPPLIVALAGDLLPVTPGFAVHPLPLAVSAAYGLLIALAFALPPLARARMLPAAAIFRAVVDRRFGIDRRTLGLVAAAAIAVLGLAIGTSLDPLFAAAVIGAVLGALLLLLGLGWGIRRAARAAPRPRRPLLRLAIANLHRPGAQTVGLVVALGLALTLFVTLAAIQTSLAAEISRTVPQRAPDLFVLDIPSDQGARFTRLVREQAPAAELNIVPALRGTIVAYGDTRVADLATLPEGAWFLRGERGVTYSPVLPEGSELTDGSWWPRGYVGTPLVSLDEEAAAVMGVGVGDTLTVSVLGREIRATIFSLRRINWDTLGFNYIMVFSPHTFRTAPHSLTATIQVADDRAGAVTRALLDAFPAASVIETGEVIGQVRTLLDQMAAAILIAATVTIFAGIAVLIGAIAASRQARSYDSVILKTLGATRGQILAAQATEYGLLAGLLAMVALALGLPAAWYVIVRIFDFGWAPDWPTVLATLAAGGLGTLALGLLGSLPLISVRPAAALRSL
jgi:putative ABC transport system permease protein